MAKIDLVAEVLKHTDDEIIEYLANEARAVRKTWKNAIETGDPNRVYAGAADLEIIITVLIAMDRRNENRDIQ